MAKAAVSRERLKASYKLKVVSGLVTAFLNENEATRPPTITLGSKVAALDKAWLEVEASFNALSNYAQEESQTVNDLEIYWNDIDLHDLTMIRLEELMVIPASPKLQEDVLVLEATRNREEKLMGNQLWAIQRQVGLQLEFVWEAKAHFEKVRMLSLTFKAKDSTKQAQVDLYLETKPRQLNERAKAIWVKVAMLMSSLPGEQGTRHEKVEASAGVAERVEAEY